MKTTNISNFCPVCGNPKIWGAERKLDEYIEYPWVCPCGARGVDNNEIVYLDTDYEKPSSDQLEAFFISKYGKEWDRCSLTEIEEIAWVDALYEWYENECPRYPVYRSQDDGAWQNGKPFEIVRRTTCVDGFDIGELPLWVIRVEGDEFFASYEELFNEPSAAELGLFAKKSKQGYPVIYRNGTDCILFREDCKELPYVVANGYDSKTGEWSHGNYLESLQAALVQFGSAAFSADDLRDLLKSKEGVFFATYWTDEDIIEALRENDIEPSQQRVEKIARELIPYLEDFSETNDTIVRIALRFVEEQQMRNTA